VKFKMNLILFLLLGSAGLINFFKRFENRKYVLVSICFGILMFCLTFWNITYFVDRYNYEVMFENIDDYNTDFIFVISTVFALMYGLSFDDLYQVHILIMAIFCGLLISRFTTKILFVVFMLCVFRYVDYANQIRFYLGFFVGLYSLYLMMVRKKFIIGILFSLFAILSHFSLLVIFVTPVLYKYIEYFHAKRIFFINLLNLMVLGVIINFVSSVFPTYSKYFTDPDGQSSFLGGLFDSFPAIVCAFFIFKNHAEIQGDLIMKYDRNYRFLYSLSAFSLLCISCGFFYRIVIDRFVFSFSIIWLCYFIYSLKFSKKCQHFIMKVKLLSLSLFISFWFYFASAFFLGTSFYLEEAFMMLNFR
jgi:hypothetical protein